ncbi:MAG TPA: glutaredoxin family protein [Solirubrobacteraceae bacterium]|jgi:glutaredoxin|nr:glutaredoxin family protein [Solirubrobacteraceae bacterium]
MPPRDPSAIALVTVYSKPDCHLCSDAMAVLERLRSELGFDLEELDISRDEALLRAYFERIPVIALDGEELFDFFVDEAILRERLESRQ